MTRVLDANGKKLVLGEKTLVMGIVNVTPDSFSDGGDYNTADMSIRRIEDFISDGVDIVDIGGESTRPGSTEVSLEEELRRVIPVIEKASALNTLISIDSYKSEVAKKALLAGANIINDVWGFQKDENMAHVAAEYDVPSILMHNKTDNIYERDIIEEMKFFFDRSVELALRAGLSEDRIILDPGIGFGKNPIQNIEVMNRLDEIIAFGYPVLLGTSRKSMIGHILNVEPKDRLTGTIATNVIGAQKGVSIVRVHDVIEHVHAMKVTDAILGGR